MTSLREIEFCFLSLQISELFGGMEVCGVSVVVGKDGREYIIKASDSTFALMGDSQEDDRRQIADLVTSRMQVTYLFKQQHYRLDIHLRINF